MTNPPRLNSEAEEQRFQSAEGFAPASHRFYADLCALEELQQACTHVKENSQELGVDPLALETIEAEGADAFLQQLSSDLQAQTYQPARRNPANDAENGEVAALRDLVVQVALKRLLEAAFPPAFPADPEPENTIKRLVRHIDKGLCRVYAANLNESLEAGAYKYLLARAARRIGDPPLIGLLKKILTAARSGDRATIGSDRAATGRLLPLWLADVAYEGIDQILQQAMTFGREENFFHVQCTRVGNELMVLSDRDPRYEWILPAVQKRLREELANFHMDMAAVDTQSLEAIGGEPLRFLDFELSYVKGGHGALQVQYRRLVKKPSRRQAEIAPSPQPPPRKKPIRRQAEKAPPRQRRPWIGLYNPLRLALPGVNWLGRRPSWQLVRKGYRKANSIQASWRHLPITLYPILAILLGWNSPVSWVCLALIFVCNWRWIFHNVYRKASSIQVGWRHLPITLYPILAFLLGWRSPVAWLCLALIFVCNWRWTLRFIRSAGTWTWRHKLDVVLGTCALTALICLVPFISDAYANRPREVAVSSTMPPGFYLGEYHGDSWWNGSPTPGVDYGLYVPPHLQDRKGPYPLIVFLHGFGKRTKKQIFESEFPVAVAHRFGANGPNGPLDFIAFFPIDPTGRWQAGTPEVDNVMTALDYVIRRYRIDPSRVYLTGVSAGGSGVWSLAEAYPNKWAAVAPICSFISPDTAKVRHLPAWIFHGAQDKLAPVERERILVRQLQEAGADVHYTERPNRGHYMADEAYNPKELYEWFLSKKKN